MVERDMDVRKKDIAGISRDTRRKEMARRYMDVRKKDIAGKGRDGRRKEMVGRGVDCGWQEEEGGEVLFPGGTRGSDRDGRRKEREGEGGTATVRRGMNVMGKEIVVRYMSG